MASPLNRVPPHLLGPSRCRPISSGSRLGCSPAIPVVFSHIHLPGLRAADLLPLESMVQVTWEDDQDRMGGGRTSRCFPYDRCLLTTLVNRWRPDTHTFHLPCGEIAPTLQDVIFLTELPCVGFPLATHDVPTTWRTEFLARFQGVLPPNTGYREFSNTHRLSLKWIYQFYLERMAEDALEYTIGRPQLDLRAYIVTMYTGDDVGTSKSDSFQVK
uniref:PH01B001G05.14 protein n=1 Tax=Phyllostachys edulis TaxID=38705 RepID=L0P1J5_PHYED|nr:PH01B001G05.14 [Phyllostachys edulis]